MLRVTRATDTRKWARERERNRMMQVLDISIMYFPVFAEKSGVDTENEKQSARRMCEIRGSQESGHS